MSLIKQANRLFYSEFDSAGKVDLVDQDGFIVAKGLRQSDAKWIIDSHVVAKAKAAAVQLSKAKA